MKEAGVDTSGDLDSGMRGERGAGTVVLIAVMLIAVMLSAASVAGARSVYLASRAQSAADFAALGAAETLRFQGESAACTSAENLAARNGARLETCEVLGHLVHVTVSVRTPLVFILSRNATAGPADEPP